MKDSTNKQYETVKLPSKGQCYHKDSPLRKGEVEISYLTAKDENIIFNPKSYTNARLLDDLLGRKVLSESDEPLSFCKGDRDALLIWLRRTAYGNDFPVFVKDDASGKKFSTVIDLSEIKYRNFDLTGDENGYFQYFLKNGHFLKFKYPSATEISDIRKTIIEKEKNEGNRILMTEGLASVTMSVNGNDSRDYITQYIENMRASEAFLYRSFIYENQPGIETIVTVDLPKELGGGIAKAFLDIDESLFLNMGDNL